MGSQILMSEDVRHLFDPGRRAQAAAYARAQRHWLLVQGGVLLLYFAAWVVTGWARDLGNELTAHIGWSWAQVAAAFLVVGAGAWLLDTAFALPGHILARRYHQSTEDWEHWFTDRIKEGLLGAIVGGLLLEIIYILLESGNPVWWLWAASSIIVVLVIITLAAPIWIAPLFFSFTPIQDEELRRRLLALANRMNIPVLDVYRFDMSTRTGAANAAVIGLGRTRRIILADTLLATFTPEEIEGVLAHELAHHVNRDIIWGLLLNSMLIIVALKLADVGLHAMAKIWQIAPGAPHTVPFLLLLLMLYSMIVSPITSLWSRSREWLADLFAVQVTGKGRTYARALARLADQNLAELFPPRWYVGLFGSHPPLGERVALAWAYGDLAEESEQDIDKVGQAEKRMQSHDTSS